MQSPGAEKWFWGPRPGRSSEGVLAPIELMRKTGDFSEEKQRMNMEKGLENKDQDQ